ncbi:arrestin domain-containing protein 3-like isoform X2 [Dunckerocampus dactyliophorus]|uniref:arrestin domain-containing protein 3-like isoform X2 n=1 Tax=Dunckerocampus dactyliophorus TaxID=161453 RepID=UPI002405D2A2|nr:arrestin domain-containing protein 3-like isoform X2 [Dunckerocampus dactyliophorus]
MTISHFSIEYDAINHQNTFTNGDTIKGRIIVVASKETKIQTLTLIAKGKGEAHSSDEDSTFSVNEKYYTIRQEILGEARQDGFHEARVGSIAQGRNVFPFSFKIPDRDMPSSIKSSLCRIVHKLKAELKQSMKLPKKADTYFTFVSKPAVAIPGLMTPQHGCKQTSINLGSGTVSMDVHTDKMGYKQGEALHIRIEILNQSTRLVTPTVMFFRKETSFGNGYQSIAEKKLLQMEAQPVASGRTETVIKRIPIPRRLPPSVLNCCMFTLEYKLKVYLDIKYKIDQGVIIPIVVLPGIQEQPTPAACEGEASGNPYRPTRSSTPQSLEPPPSYEALYPSK